MIEVAPEHANHAVGSRAPDRVPRAANRTERGARAGVSQLSLRASVRCESHSSPRRRNLELAVADVGCAEVAFDAAHVSRETSLLCCPLVTSRLLATREGRRERKAIHSASER